MNASNHDEQQLKRNRITAITLFLLSCILSETSAILDKFILNNISPNQMQFWFMMLVSIILWICFFAACIKNKNRLVSKSDFKNFYIYLIAFILIIADRFLFTALSQPDVLVSGVSVIKQISIIVSVVFGGIWFKEPKLKNKLAFLAIILAGNLTPQEILNIEFKDTIAGGGIIINGSSSATMDEYMVNAKSVGFSTYYVGEYGENPWYEYNGNYAGCFTSDTYVTIWDEKKKKLRRKKAKKLTYKDKLLVWNFDKGCFEFVNALWIQKEKVADKYTLIKFSDGSKLKVVQDHAVFNYDKQMFCPICSNQAWGCPIGTRVVRDDGKIVTIVSKKVINKKVEYTNIFSKYHMNIYTSGILTSTAFNNMYKIENMKYVKDVEKKCYNRSLLDGISKEWIEGMRLEEFPDNILIEGIKHFANCKTFKDYIDMKIEEQKFDL